MPDKKDIIIGFASISIIFLILFFSGIYLIGDPMLRGAFIFSSTAQFITREYPLEVSTGDIFAHAERSLFEQLDPFSFRLERQDYDYMLEESSGKYGGIGISIVPRDTLLMVMAVREDGPGQAAGMKSGDLIVSVDGQPVPPDNPARSISAIRGPAGSELNLTIYRPAIDDTIPLTLTRSDIKLEHLTYFGLTENMAGYIRIADFESGLTEDLEEAMVELESQAPIGYIIDLKGNPGGYLDEAIDAADLFLDKDDLIVGTDSRSRWRSQTFYASREPVTDKAIVILTDRGSASAAEIFAGALRGAQQAVLVGDTTFGKGLVQTVFGLANSDAIRLTTSRYYFADGRYLNPPGEELKFIGLAPDLIYKYRGETAFQEMILSGFLIYDFVDAHLEFLDIYPDNFNYPDTVIILFENFIQERGITYRSWLTDLVDLTILDQKLNDGSDRVINELEKLQALSEISDQKAYRRWADFVKFQIRRLVVERRSGRAAAYREVIVPGRDDIRLAESILTDRTVYDSLMITPAELDSLSNQ